MDERYVERRKHVEQFFIASNLKPDSKKVAISPSGRFQIEISRYLTLPNSWEYSRGIVSNTSNGEIIADIKRNYGHFWHAWVEHPNGNEYLLCGEDYQGYSVLNLQNGKYQAHFPEAGYKGVGFCWIAVYPSPDRLVLAVDGCYWGCPYELVIVDFREPENTPYSELVRFDALDSCEGWIDNDTFSLRREIMVRKSDGANYESLSDIEQQALDDDPTLVDYWIETILAQRPSF